MTPASARIAASLNFQLEQSAPDIDVKETAIACRHPAKVAASAVLAVAIVADAIGSLEQLLGCGYPSYGLRASHGPAQTFPDALGPLIQPKCR